jgi:predicted acylesterase/phospholipase RssA
LTDTFCIFFEESSKETLMSEITTLVLSGGGIRTLAFIGTFRKLEDNKILAGIDTICAVSAGCVAGLMLILGFTYDEMVQEICTTDFEKFKCIKYTNFLYGYGLVSGEGIVTWLKSLLVKKGFLPETTFKDLYLKTNRNLKVVVCNLNKHSLEIFDMSSSPDLKVTDAIRMSISIPFMFSANKYLGNTYVDGGLVDNFPIGLFSEKTTLGICLVNEAPIPVTETIDNFESYTVHVFSCFFSARQKDSYKSLSNVIKIDTGSITQTVNFNIKLRDRLKLIERGYLSICEQLKN